MRKSLPLAFAAVLMASFSTVHAADYDLDGGNYYGNLHAGFNTEGLMSSPSAFVPYFNIGSKVAYDVGPGALGYQIDGDFNYVDSSWISSAATGTGTLFTNDAAIHLTYIVDQDKKLGLYIGQSGLSIDVKNLTGLGAIQQAWLNLGMVGIGAEGLVALSDQTTAQVRAAIVDPIYIDSGSTDGVNVTSKKSFDLSAGWGYSVSAGVSHQFTQNISGRADAAFASLNYNGAGSYSFYNASLTGQYSFDEAPISLGATVGYSGGSMSAGSAGAVSAGLKATYSFGGPAEGAKGKLFRSGLLNLVN